MPTGTCRLGASRVESPQLLAFVVGAATQAHVACRVCCCGRRQLGPVIPYGYASGGAYLLEEGSEETPIWPVLVLRVKTCGMWQATERGAPVPRTKDQASTPEGKIRIQ